MRAILDLMGSLGLGSFYRYVDFADIKGQNHRIVYGPYPVRKAALGFYTKKTDWSKVTVGFCWFWEKPKEAKVCEWETTIWRLAELDPEILSLEIIKSFPIRWQFTVFISKKRAYYYFQVRDSFGKGEGIFNLVITLPDQSCRVQKVSNGKFVKASEEETRLALTQGVHLAGFLPDRIEELAILGLSSSLTEVKNCWAQIGRDIDTGAGIGGFIFEP